MPNADRENRIDKVRRGYHRWFFATLGSLSVCTFIAFLVLDPYYRFRIGLVAGIAGLWLISQWLNLFATVNEKDDWLDAARRHDELAKDECAESYYVEVGETRTPTGATAPRQFQLGASRARAACLAAVITGILETHGHEWTPNALDEVAAAFRAGDDELARIVQERATGPIEVRIQA